MAVSAQLKVGVYLISVSACGVESRNQQIGMIIVIIFNVLFDRHPSHHLLSICSKVRGIPFFGQPVVRGAHSQGQGILTYAGLHFRDYLKKIFSVHVPYLWVLIHGVQDIKCLISYEPVIGIHIDYDGVLRAKFLHIHVHVSQCSQFLMVFDDFHFVFGSVVGAIEVLVEVIGRSIR